MRLSPDENSLRNQPPRLVSHTHYCVTGDVTVAEGAIIAPGVVLQALPGSRITIATGTCLAGGVCIQSRQGVLTIELGVSLGANVLIVGHGKIGTHACVSPGSTLMNPQIEADALLPPNTLLGEALIGGRSAKKAASSPANSVGSGSSYTYKETTNGASSGASTYSASNSFSDSFSNGASDSFSTASTHQENDSFVNTFVEPPPIGPKAIEIPDLNDQNGEFVDPSVQNNGVQLSNGYNNSSGALSTPSSNNGSALSVPANDRVYGKDQVSQLISTLFPNRPSP